MMLSNSFWIGFLAGAFLVFAVFFISRLLKRASRAKAMEK
jgi:hypothetical protein